MVGTRISLREQAVPERVTSWLVTASESFVVTGQWGQCPPQAPVSHIWHLQNSCRLTGGGDSRLFLGSMPWCLHMPTTLQDAQDPGVCDLWEGCCTVLAICGAFGPGFACLQAGAGGRCVERGACMVKPGCWSAYTPPLGAQVDDVFCV